MANKKNIKVRDLKPNKDAKGGGPHIAAGKNPPHGLAGGKTPSHGLYGGKNPPVGGSI